jgi:hypothetical protein
MLGAACLIISKDVLITSARAVCHLASERRGFISEGLPSSPYPVTAAVFWYCSINCCCFYVRYVSACDILTLISTACSLSGHHLCKVTFSGTGCPGLCRGFIQSLTVKAVYCLRGLVVILMCCKSRLIALWNKLVTVRNTYLHIKKCCISPCDSDNKERLFT